MIRPKSIVVMIKTEIPHNVKLSEFEAYVEEAVTSWSGQFESEHPLFGWFHDEEDPVPIKVIANNYVKVKRA